jgi:hypothetical protein
MRLKGSASWRLSLDNPQTLDIALFMRDSVGLVPPPSPDVPPVLAVRVSDHTAVLTDAARIEAGGQWLGWWRRLIAHESTPRPVPAGTEEEMVAQSRRRLDEYQRVMDPPDFESMADLPALRTAAVATCMAASGWLTATRRPGTGPLLLDHALVRGVVEEIIAEHGVSPDQLDAAVLVLNVAGAWSYLARPGAVCCSVGVINDPVAARAVLREAFITGLAA